MVKVEFLGPINKKAIEVEVKSLKELREILNKDENLKKWLENSAVALNDKLINTLEIELKDGDKISILPPVCGG
ncbi:MULTISPECIES: MoaD/ThiS family protein [unclassified Lebetimonas]|jgi:molybdopterin synthase sulfur carrier subunit|uniref:MoaD/ThiS family protein n=1 Tax=unclassified Lebetimonas TaxID=2648158 RepID=UPI0004664B47|nr:MULTISPECIES: MoaD/ThiS family protein [unclassified Lebetimonas]